MSWQRQSRRQDPVSRGAFCRLRAWCFALRCDCEPNFQILVPARSQPNSGRIALAALPTPSSRLADSPQLLLMMNTKVFRWSKEMGSKAPKWISQTCTWCYINILLNRGHLLLLPSCSDVREEVYSQTLVITQVNECVSCKEMPDLLLRLVFTG